MTTLREAAQQALEAKQTPLIELLERIPQDARLVVEHDQFSSSYHPVGRLCHEAAAALRAALAEPVQEPVALAWSNLEGTKFVGNGEKWKHKDCVVPLYTSLPQRKPLSAVDLRALYDQHAAYQEEGPEASGWWDFARAIERAHNIT